MSNLWFIIPPVDVYIGRVTVDMRDRVIHE
jgi:hypothetical protein